MARAPAELLAVSVLRGPVPGGGCTAKPPPVVPDANAPVVFDPFVIFLAPPVLVILLCALARWAAYRATNPIAANSTAAVTTNVSCFCTRTLPTRYYKVYYSIDIIPIL